MALIYVCAAVVFVILWQLCLVFKEKSKPPDSRLPGPSVLPIIGNAHQLDIKNPHLTLTEMSQRHGPIYKIKLLTDHWLVINNYDMAREVCITKGRDFSGRPQSYRFAVCIKDCKLEVLGDLTNTCRSTRNLMAKSMSLFGVSSKQIESVNRSMINDLMDLWAEKGKACKDCDREQYCSKCKAIKPCYSCRDDACRLACRLMIKGIVGENVEYDSPEIDRIMSYEHYIVDGIGPGGSGLLLDLFPWLRFLGNKAWSALSTAFALSHAIYSFYKPRILASLDTTNSAMHVVLSQASLEKSEITNDLAEGIMGTLFGTSVSTSATMMHVIVVVLAKHQHIQRKIQNELESVIGNNTPDVSDTAKLPYTMATLTELLRNASIVPLALPHKAVCDTSVAGYNIPKGVNVFVNVWAINHDPDFWDDPYDYKPERFLNAEGELLPPEHPRRRRVMTFGGGPRSCIGEAFARKHLFLFITSLCRRFNLRLTDKEAAFTDPRTFKMGGPTLEPRTCGVDFLPRY